MESPPENVPIVISGISGRFPNAENVEEFWTDICKNKDPGKSQHCQDLGNGQTEVEVKKLKCDPKIFDSTFFGLQKTNLEPTTIGQIFEVVYEVILDSGTSPSELCHKDVGLFLASQNNTFSDNDMEHVAKIFNFTGTRNLVKNGQLLQTAFEALQSNECDCALILSTNLQYEGCDAKMDEHISAFFVQKRVEARREYVRILGVHNNTTTNGIDACQSELVTLMKLVLHVQHGASPENSDVQGLDKLENGTVQVHFMQKKESGSHFATLQIPAWSLSGKRIVSPIPVLVPLVGRSKKGVHEMMQKVVRHPGNFPFEALLQKMAEGDSGKCSKCEGVTVCANPVRGYLIRGDAASIESSYKEVPAQKMPLWLIFSGTPGSLWPGMANDLIKFKVFAKSIAKSAEIVKPFGIDLNQILMHGDAGTLDRWLGVGYIAMGVACIDLLRDIGVEPDGYIGHSGGELLCGYFDGCLSHEEALVSYYWKDECVQSVLGGTMASVALTWEQAVKKCPPWIYPACHNAKNNVTIAGLAKDVPAFLAELRIEGVLGFEVNSGGIAYHTRYLKPMLAKLESKLRELFKSETVVRKRSKKFVSTSIPEKDWAKSRNGDDIVDYIINNIRNPVLFHPMLRHIPHHSVVIEVSPNAHMIAILEKTLGKTCSVWGLEKQNGGNNAIQFLNGIGKLYEHGHHLLISKLYPDIQFPVPIGTPMISPLVTWNRAIY